MTDVKSILLYGENLQFVLFKNAFNFAENGQNVWFISPEPFKKFPPGIEPPDKAILKQLTFLYLANNVELLRCINEVHIWYKVPELIILNEFHKYADLCSDTCNLNNAAYLIASLLDAVAACGRKLSKRTYLLVAGGDTSSDCVDKLQIIVDLYFKEVVQICKDNVNYIMNY